MSALVPLVEPPLRHAQRKLKLTRQLLAHLALRIIACHLPQKRGCQPNKVSEFFPTACRYHGLPDVGDSGALDVLQTLVECGVIALGKHALVFTLRGAYKQHSMEPNKQAADPLLLVLERIATAIEKLQWTPTALLTIQDKGMSAAELFGHTPISSPSKTPPAPAELLPDNAASAGASSAAAIPYETVRKAVYAYHDAKGEHQTQELLKRFGAKYMQDLKRAPERYAELLEALRS